MKRSPARAIRAPIVALFSGAVGAIAIAACSHEGAPFDCECSMLTDYDDGWKLTARVCAADAREAPEVARGCAQLGAPAPVQSCACRAVEPAATCRHGCRD